MNRKGFTLIELLMVISIIAVLSLILIPNVVVLKDKNDVRSCQSLEKYIISSAKMYVADNKYDLNLTCGGTKNITLQDLVDHGYLTEPITNPETKTAVSLTKKVSVTYNCTTRTFDYEFTLSC